MKNRRLVWLIFFGFQVATVSVLGFFPATVEQFYSNGFYPILSLLFRNSTSWFPFSVGDIAYFLLIVLLLNWLIQLFKKHKPWKSIAFDFLRGLSIFYFLFYFCWGLNYHRLPLFEKMNIEKEYSDADLLAFTNQMIKKTNALQIALTGNPNNKVISDLSQEKIFELSLSGYQQLAKQHPYFTYKTPSIKKSLLSVPLSYMGFSGYLNPFTNEAQVNDCIPILNFPFTTCHEMAHQIGYASESEANFISFLAVTKNKNLLFKYAGYSSALRYCLRNWEARNPEIGKQLLKHINLGVVQNFKDSELHWMQYDTFIEEGFKLFYDNFLKINQQEEGLESYSKFLNLLINYEKKQPI